MKKNLVIKIPVKIPADLINVTSVQLAGGTEKYLRGVLDGDPVISFETVVGYDSSVSDKTESVGSVSSPIVKREHPLTRAHFENTGKYRNEKRHRKHTGWQRLPRASCSASSCGIAD